MGEYLEHHGIKGMKWGVRRSKEELGGTESGDREARAVTAAASRDEYREAKSFRKAAHATDLAWEEAHAKTAMKNYSMGLSEQEIRRGQEMYNRLKSVNDHKTLNSIFETASDSLAYAPGSYERKKIDELTRKVTRHTKRNGEVSIFGAGASSKLNRWRLESEFNTTRVDRFGRDWGGEVNRELERIDREQTKHNRKR